jgi:hypothetical protein
LVVVAIELIRARQTSFESMLQMDCNNVKFAGIADDDDLARIASHLQLNVRI